MKNLMKIVAKYVWMQISTASFLIVVIYVHVSLVEKNYLNVLYVGLILCVSFVFLKVK